MPVQHLASLGVGGAPYLLDDEFTDTRAAGAVNGTPAVPGPSSSNRTLVDTENKVSLAGGEWVCAGGKAAPVSTGDPGGHWGSYARVAGRVLLAKFSVTAVGGTFVHIFGWHSTGTNGNTGRQALVAADSVNLVIVDNGGATKIIASYSAGAAEEWAISARAAGGYFWFRKVSGNYLLVWIATIGSSDPLYAYSYTFDKAYKIDRLRVPQSLYIPTPLAYAAFGGGDGVLGNTDVVGPDGQASPVAAWVSQVGAWAIASGKATATALSGGLAIATVPTISTDVHLRVALTRSGGSVGGVARFQDSNNYLRFSHEGVNALCEQVVAGVPTTLRTGAATFVSGAYIYLIVSGTTGWLFYNNVAIGASFTVPSSTFGAHGLYTTNVGNTMDNFEAWPYGTGGEHAALGLM